MGTRNLTCVVKDGKFKVAQYCQWDGYPDGQGRTVAEFILKHINPDGGKSFSEKVDQIVYPSSEEVEKRWRTVGAKGNWVNMEQAEKFAEKWEHLTRDFGAKILEYIVTTDEPECVLSEEFAADSLFCEWAYVLDLDKGVLEIYKGFNKRALGKKQRFRYLQDENKHVAGHRAKTAGHRAKTEYYPVRLWKKIPFEKVHAVTMDELQSEYMRAA
jgi:hypothetical protein